MRTGSEDSPADDHGNAEAGRHSGAGEDTDVGGDPVCWLHLVCPECGAFADEPDTPCPRCGHSPA